MTNSKKKVSSFFLLYVNISFLLYKDTKDTTTHISLNRCFCYKVA